MGKERATNPIIIYTDGSCDPNPGPGGWAALIIMDSEEKMLYGSAASSTNNRMELIAAIEALQSIEIKKPIILYTDSQYLKKGVMEWMENWKLRNWKRKGGKLANVDLWKELSKETEKHSITWRWVKAHAGDKYNEQVDRKAKQLAYKARKKR
jgi:ribonuclease HI